LPLPRANSRHTLGTVAGLGVPLGARGSAHWLHTLYSMAARNSPFPLLDPGSTLMGVNVHGPRDVDNRMRTQRRTEADACSDLEAIAWRAVVVLGAGRELASRAADPPGCCPRGTGDAP